jgi:hypothetical protein
MAAQRKKSPRSTRNSAWDNNCAECTQSEKNSAIDRNGPAEIEWAFFPGEYLALALFNFHKGTNGGVTTVLERFA